MIRQCFGLKTHFSRTLPACDEVLKLLGEGIRRSQSLSADKNSTSTPGMSTVKVAPDKTRKINS
jgi:hypothetical protein